MSYLYKIFILFYIFIAPHVFAASGDVIYSNNSILPCQVGENVQSLSDASSCAKQVHTFGTYTVTYMYSRVSGTNTIYQYFNYYDSQRNTNITYNNYFRILNVKKSTFEALTLNLLKYPVPLSPPNLGKKTIY